MYIYILKLIHRRFTLWNRVFFLSQMFKEKKKKEFKIISDFHVVYMCVKLNKQILKAIFQRLLTGIIKRIK